MSDELYPDELLGVRPGHSGPVDMERSYGIARHAHWLRQIGDPAVLERAADALEQAGKLGLIMFFPHVCDEDLMPEVVAEMRSFAEDARRSLEAIEAFGLTWDFETGRGTFPTGSHAHDLYVDLVGAAWRELYPNTMKVRRAKATLAKLRARLLFLLPDEELTDDKLWSKLRSYHRRIVS